MDRRNFLKKMTTILGYSFLSSPLKVFGTISKNNDEKEANNTKNNNYDNNYSPETLQKLINLIYLKSFNEIENFKHKKQLNQNYNEKNILKWFEIIQIVKKLDLNQKVFQTRRLLNNLPLYSDSIVIESISDLKSKGEKEYFRTPFETLTDMKADCEDYVLLWFFTLLQAGIPMDKMFFGIVLSNSSDFAHICLYVKSTNNDSFFVLDNLLPEPTTFEKHLSIYEIYLIFKFNINIWEVIPTQTFIAQNNLKTNKLDLSFKNNEIKHFLEIWKNTYKKAQYEFSIYNIETNKSNNNIKIDLWLRTLRNISNYKGVELLNKMPEIIGNYTDSKNNSITISIIEEYNSQNNKNLHKTPFQTIKDMQGTEEEIILVWYFSLIKLNFLIKNIFTVYGKDKVSGKIKCALYIKIQNTFYVLDPKVKRSVSMDMHSEYFEIGFGFNGSDNKIFDKKFFTK